MAKVIAIVNQKGGVAKSTSCVNLGIGLVKKGYKVLAIDFDPQGSLTESLGYQNPDELEITVATILHCEMNGLELPESYGILHHEEGLDILPANIELSGVEVSLVNVMSREYVLKQFIKLISPEYDYILIDNMPSLGMLTVNALAAADSVIIPVMAHYLPVKGLEQLMQTIYKVRKQINRKLQIDGILLTMVDRRTNFSKEIIELLHDNYGEYIHIFETAIPFSIRAAETSAEGISIYKHDPKGRVAEAYKKLVEEVIDNGSERE